MAKNNKAAPKVQVKSSKKGHNQYAEMTREQMEKFKDLLALRRDGILSRQEFRLMCWDKGLNKAIKGVPEYQSFEVVKTDAGTQVVSVTKPWARFGR